MLRNNVVTQYGQSQFGDLPVCAKSGTAEVGGGKQPHAWFVGFVDDVNTPLAFLVLVENGGSGASVAGSVAAQVLAKAAAN
jgi:peptidoglycan glycosyltransferase